MIEAEATVMMMVVAVVIAESVKHDSDSKGCERERSSDDGGGKVN